MSTIVLTHLLKIALSSGDVAVDSADACDRVPNWLIKMYRSPQCFSAKVTEVNRSIKKEIGSGGC